MWLRATPTKGMMVRQHILQLFSEAGQWASLVNASKLPVHSGSKMRNSIQAVYKPGSQPSSEIPMKDLAIWLGKQVGVTLTCTARLEEYAAHALDKTAHSSTSRLRKHLHEMARTKDCLDCWKWRLVESTWLDSELLVQAPTNQSSMTASSAITPHPFNPEKSPTEMYWPHTPMAMFTWGTSMTQWLTTYTNKVIR